MSGRLRVAHIGTGFTGSLALRKVLRSPGLELVGHWVHSPMKAGRDSGELVGTSPAGVVATDRLDRLLALDADCVTYFATTSGRDPDEVVDQICLIAASGKNVITPSYHAFFHPASLDDGHREKLSIACASGSSSVFATGIAPGFATDVLAVHAASMSTSPSSISIAERLQCSAYSAPGFFAALGFGRTVEEDAQLREPGGWAEEFAIPLRVLAEGLGYSIERIEKRREVALADRDYRFAAGDIQKGTIASVRLTVEGITAAQRCFELSAIFSMPDESVDDWQPVIASGSGVTRLTRIVIDGDPPVEVDFALKGSGLPGAKATAARVVNAIPAVCAAGPGLLSGLDLLVTPS